MHLVASVANLNILVKKTNLEIVSAIASFVISKEILSEIGFRLDEEYSILTIVGNIRLLTSIDFMHIISTTLDKNQLQLIMRMLVILKIFSCDID
jgi:hypothetical protein